MARRTPARSQRGAISIIAALAMVALVSMLGLLIDIGHLYIVKTELQNAADSCALSAARELNDRSAGAANRGKAAGITAGSSNRMDLQQLPISIDWDGVKFSANINGPWVDTVGDTTVYARCALFEEVNYSVVQWVWNFTARRPMQLWAEAVARPVGGQSFCAIPIAMCSTRDDASDFVKGRWYSGRLSAGTAATGNYDWVRFPGAQGASDLADILSGPGVCSLDAATADAQAGVVQGVAPAWNTRFGLYSGKYNEVDNPPDHVGYAFTKDSLNGKGETIPGSWPYLHTTPAPPLASASNAYPPRLSSTAPVVPADAYDGTTPYARPAGSQWQAKVDANYSMRKNEAGKAGSYDASLLPFDPRSLLDDKGKPMNLVGNPRQITGTQHHDIGQDRRMVFVPVIKCADWEPNKKNLPIVKWACAFMIHPVNDPDKDVELEFRGLEGQAECGTTGVPGDFGPPVPALVK